MLEPKFEPLFRLNHSEYGEVILLENANHRGEWVLQKFIHGLPQATRTALSKKLAARMAMDHPNLVALKGFHLADAQDFISLSLQFSPHSSLDLAIESSDPVYRWLLDTLAALVYLNELEYLHGDIRPEYVLFFPDECMFKLADKFALSGNSRSKIRQCVAAGKQVYVSPRVFEMSMQEHLAQPGDIDQFKEESFAVGMACLRVWMGDQPGFRSIYDYKKGEFNVINFRETLATFQGALDSDKDIRLFHFLQQNLLCLDENLRKTPKEALEILRRLTESLPEASRIAIDPAALILRSDWTLQCRRIAENDPENTASVMFKTRLESLNNNGKACKGRNSFFGHKRIDSAQRGLGDDGRKGVAAKEKKKGFVFREDRVHALVTKLKNKWTRELNLPTKSNGSTLRYELPKPKKTDPVPLDSVTAWVRKIKEAEKAKMDSMRLLCQDKKPVNFISNRRHTKQPSHQPHSERVVNLLRAFSQSKRGSFGPINLPVTKTDTGCRNGSRGSRKSLQTQDKSLKALPRRFLSITIEESGACNDLLPAHHTRCINLDHFHDGLSILLNQKMLKIAQEADVIHTAEWMDLRDSKVQLRVPFPEMFTVPNSDQKKTAGTEAEASPTESPRMRSPGIPFVPKKSLLDSKRQKKPPVLRKTIQCASYAHFGAKNRLFGSSTAWKGRSPLRPVLPGIKKDGYLSSEASRSANQNPVSLLSSFRNRPHPF